MTRHFSIHENHPKDARLQRRNGRSGYTEHCPHCNVDTYGNCRTLASRGYYEQTALCRCGSCGERFVSYG